MTAKAAVEVPKPLRLETITLRAYRAFSAEQPIPINGRNLVVYGENGAGKSSLYKALRDLFARRPRRDSLVDGKHVHALDDELTPRVTVTFNDNRGALEWSPTRHPGIVPADPRIAAAALRSSFLDYHALLQTNALHGLNRPNLFDLAVDVLLADFADATSSATIEQRWTKLKLFEKGRHRKDGRHLPPIEKACADFNAAIDVAVVAMTPIVNDLLIDLGHGDMVIEQFERASVYYSNDRWVEKRILLGREIYPVLKIRGYIPRAPQVFLNEARLSALALAIYLAGRLACVPSVISVSLKLLVLDDVLVGLDYGNRRPLLDVLKKHFDDWQVVLLTHDRHWFEIVRAAITADRWTCHEMYEMIAVTGEATPFVRPVAPSVVIATLDQADAFLGQRHLPAAANYARSACEMFFRKYCENHPKLLFPYKADPKKGLSFDKLRGVIAASVADDASKKAAMKALEPFQQRILNPLSHDPSTSLNQAEVEAALKAVREMVEALN